ncbi:MAG TPA: hypothetical protein VFF06_27890 [Polyangia bacterium]|nr:hypothetical protein [Polyangia bacterium]
MTSPVQDFLLIPWQPNTALHHCNQYRRYLNKALQNDSRARRATRAFLDGKQRFDHRMQNGRDCAGDRFGTKTLSDRRTSGHFNTPPRRLVSDGEIDRALDRGRVHRVLALAR